MRNNTSVFLLRLNESKDVTVDTLKYKLVQVLLTESNPMLAYNNFFLDRKISYLPFVLVNDAL